MPDGRNFQCAITGYRPISHAFPPVFLLLVRPRTTSFNQMGDDDILLWPQPYFAQNPHVAAIPRRPEYLTIEDKYYICFYVTTDRDFVCREDGPVSGLGHLHPNLLQLAKQLYSRLHDIYQNDLSFPKRNPLFQPSSCAHQALPCPFRTFTYDASRDEICSVCDRK